MELVKNVVQVETHVGEYNKLVADLKEEVSNHVTYPVYHVTWCDWHCKGSYDTVILFSG